MKNLLLAFITVLIGTAGYALPTHYLDSTTQYVYIEGIGPYSKEVTKFSNAIDRVNYALTEGMNFLENTSQSDSITYIYDSEGNITQVNEYALNGDTTRTDFTFNLLNNVTSEIYSTIENGNLENHRKTEYVYNSENRVIEEAEYTYNSGWEADYKYIHTFNSSDIQTREQYFYKDNNGVLMLNRDEQYNYINSTDFTINITNYDADGTTIISEKKEESILINSFQETTFSIKKLNDWIIYQLDTTNLDTNNEIIDIITYEWDTASGEPLEKSILTLDPNINHSNTLNNHIHIQSYNDKNQFIPLMSLVIYSWSEDSNDSFLYTDIQYHYTQEVPTAIFNSKETSNWSVYPNPFNKNISIASEEKITNVSIKNLQGDVVWEESIESNKFTINTNLNAGIYILNMTTASGEILVEKLITK